MPVLADLYHPNDSWALEGAYPRLGNGLHSRFLQAAAHSRHALHRPGMSPLFRCLMCAKDIERSTRSFWRHKGHLLCSSCKDQLEFESKGVSRSSGEPIR